MLRYTNWVNEYHPDYRCDKIIDKFTDLVLFFHNGPNISLEVDAMMIGQKVIIWGVSTADVGFKERTEIEDYVFKHFRIQDIEVNVKQVSAIENLPEAKVDYAISYRSKITEPYDLVLAKFISQRISEVVLTRIDVQVVFDEENFERNSVIERVTVNIHQLSYEDCRSETIKVLKEFVDLSGINFKIKELIINSEKRDSFKKYDFENRRDRLKDSSDEDLLQSLASLGIFDEYNYEKMGWEMTQAEDKRVRNVSFREKEETFGRSNNRLHQDYYGNLRIVGPKIHGRVYNSQKVTLDKDELRDELLKDKSKSSILKVEFPIIETSKLKKKVLETYNHKIPKNKLYD